MVVTVAEQIIVPDEVGAVQERLRAWADAPAAEAPSLIVTTGGTGFAVRGRAVHGLCVRNADARASGSLAT